MLETEEYVTAQHSSRPPMAGGRSGAPRVIRVLHCEQQVGLEGRVLRLGRGGRGGRAYWVGRADVRLGAG